MLSLYHKVTNGRACTVKKELQVQQCCAVNRGLLRTVHSATGARFEHPLRYLEEPSFMVLFQTAAIHGPSTLCKCSMNPDRTPIPRMPRITDLSRLRTMGIRLSTCTITTERTSGLRSKHRLAGLVLQAKVRSSLGDAWVGCTIATTALPNIGRSKSYALKGLSGFQGLLLTQRIRLRQPPLSPAPWQKGHIRGGEFSRECIVQGAF